MTQKQSLLAEQPPSEPQVEPRASFTFLSQRPKFWVESSTSLSCLFHTRPASVSGLPAAPGRNGPRVCCVGTGSAAMLSCSSRQTSAPGPRWGVWSVSAGSSLRCEPVWTAPPLMEQKPEKNFRKHRHLMANPSETPAVVVPVERKRCVASRSWGEIFTFISFSDSLKMEKSCCFCSWWETRRLVRLSAENTGRTRKWTHVSDGDTSVINDTYCRGQSRPGSLTWWSPRWCPPEWRCPSPRRTGRPLPHCSPAARWRDGTFLDVKV